MIDTALPHGRLCPEQHKQMGLRSLCTISHEVMTAGLLVGGDKLRSATDPAWGGCRHSHKM